MVLPTVFLRFALGDILWTLLPYDRWTLLLRSYWTILLRSH